MFSRIFSVGGDVLYGTRTVGAGEMLWYRYNEGTDTWADTGRDTSDSSARAGGRSTSKAATVQQKAITGPIR
jgi:hypothetical protein